MFAKVKTPWVSIYFGNNRISEMQKKKKKEEEEEDHFVTNSLLSSVGVQYRSNLTPLG